MPVSFSSGSSRLCFGALKCSPGLLLPVCLLSTLQPLSSGGEGEPTTLGNLEKDFFSGLCVWKARLGSLDLVGLGLRGQPCPLDEGGG